MLWLRLGGGGRGKTRVRNRWVKFGRYKGVVKAERCAEEVVHEAPMVLAAVEVADG